MEPTSEKFLTLKTALHLALASLRWVEDLQALLVAPTCLEFAPGMSKAILHSRAGYVPKVPRMAGRTVILQAFCLPPMSRRNRRGCTCSAQSEPLRLMSTAPAHGPAFVLDILCQFRLPDFDFCLARVILLINQFFSKDLDITTEHCYTGYSAYAFSHSPQESGRGGGTVTSPINLFIIVIYCPPGPLGDFMEEMGTLLSVFPSDSTP
ncbi:hypothetical protein QTP70_007774 [Hemibagrus guttatus]|uniref:Uncharacterized protein n=1 Tax=Hemibagrus guttatus TaxID=175788 RepID=A0AAE0QFW9_9TELE|nr:hypothetical protein QTP70_007774 [Hemibagrus guttatus]KAK3552228.1 hypothetical protein QTP86_006025 [Hemibagrus guttatus]